LQFVELAFFRCDIIDFVGLKFVKVQAFVAQPSALAQGVEPIDENAVLCMEFGVGSAKGIMSREGVEERELAGRLEQLQRFTDDSTVDRM
jgi:hypothetical protein